MRNSYANDFTIMIVELLNAGRPTKKVNEEYGVEPSRVRHWKK
jgi:uncharacterized protein YjcR